MAFVLWHAIWFAFLCRRAFSGVAGGDWSVPPYEGAEQGGLSLSPERYPPVWRNESVQDSMFGRNIADPYRWLESDSNATREFIAAEEALAAEVLGQCDSRDRFRDLFSRLYNYPKYGLPAQHGEPGGVLRWYYEYNSGLQNQSVLYSSLNASLDGSATAVLDPNALSANGSVSVSGYTFSWDGKLMAFRMSSAGSDWQTMRVVRLDNATGAATLLDDVLTGVKYSVTAWTPDDKGFFYNRLPLPADASALTSGYSAERGRQLWYHLVGTPQAADTFVLTLPEQPDASIASQITSDKQYLALSISLGSGGFNRIWYVPLAALPVNHTTGALDLGRYDMRLPAARRAALPVTKLIDDERAAWTLVATDGPVWTLHTSLNAPRFRLLRVNISNPASADTWAEVISEHRSDIMMSVLALQGDVLVVRYLRDVSAVLHLRSLGTGTLLQAVRLPGLGSVEVSGRRESPVLFFSYSSLTEPGAIYQIDTTRLTGQLPDLVHEIELPGGYNLDDYDTTQVFVVSKDGAQVPMFVVAPINTSLDGTYPTVLYGYGGFQRTITPSFSVSRLAFLRAYGGVYAVANIRGGGAKGRMWWDAGRRTEKQHSFDDFAACADYLSDSGLTSPSRLAIIGKSTGGLLMGAQLNQHPNMYAAVIADAGVMDLLRYPLFIVGQAWVAEYGDPANSTDFPYMLAASPLENIAVPNGTRQYPAVMVGTADHDDRVVPSHSYKFIAALQHTLAGYPGSPQRNPLILRVEHNAGHGAGTPTRKLIDQISDQYAFAAAAMNATWALDQELPPPQAPAPGPVADLVVAADAPDTAPPGLPAPSNVTFADGG